MPLPPNFFLLILTYDLKSMSFKFGNDFFITFEMPGVATVGPLTKSTFHCNSVYNLRSLDYCTPVALAKEGARDVILCHEKSTLERPLLNYLSNFSMYCSSLKGNENFLSIH